MRFLELLDNLDQDHHNAKFSLAKVLKNGGWGRYILLKGSAQSSL